MEELIAVIDALAEIVNGLVQLTAQQGAAIDDLTTTVAALESKLDAVESKIPTTIPPNHR